LKDWYLVQKTKHEGELPKIGEGKEKKCVAINMNM